jgi:hypothetical protein
MEVVIGNYRTWITTTVAMEQAAAAQAAADQAVANARALAAANQQAALAYRQVQQLATVPSPAGDNASIWGCIIQHESGGDPSAVNPSSGAGGLFQFMPTTWRANGGDSGDGATYLPEDASVSKQWAIATSTQAADGWSPWIGDGCTPLG